MLNKVLLIGRLTGDPKCGGQPPLNYAFFNLAVNNKVRDRSTGELKEYTEYLSISTFGKCADIIERLCHKGDLVYLEGRAATRNINTGGVRVNKTEIHCDKVKLLNRPESADPADIEDLPEE